MPTEEIKKLLECGTHFGHQTRRWNPKMKRFIFGERSGIYIIDLEKTQIHLKRAREFARSITAKGGKILFVGTKKQAKDVIEQEGQRCGIPYINHRWMGGLLTNFSTVRKSLDKLRRIEKMEADGTLAQLTKKEAAGINKERDKLLRDIGGIRDMSQLPQAIFIIDSKREEIAVKEALRLGIPIIGLIDTNCDPDPIDYPIPGNDDALKSIRYITSVLVEEIMAGYKDFLEADTVSKKAQVDSKPADAASADPAAAAAASEKATKE